MDYWRRDEVLRAYFEGKDWDENPEFKLKRKLVLEPPAELREFPFLIEDEWEVEAGQSKAGRGDLVFTDGNGRYAVVEVKFLNHERTGTTARKARRARREHVQAQATKYAQAFCHRLLDWNAKEVRAYSATTELVQCHSIWRRAFFWQEWEKDLSFMLDDRI